MYYYQLEFSIEPKLRWIELRDPLLSQSLVDEYMSKLNTLRISICNNTPDKLKLIFPCGLIINLQELNKSESNYIVSYFIQQTNIRLNNIVKYICYDNSCHISDLNPSLKDKIFVIDRFHLKNHKQSKFQSLHNCNTYPELQGLNTEICEQKFYKFSFHKHSIRHMNKERYNFFFCSCVIYIMNEKSQNSFFVHFISKFKINENVLMFLSLI